MKKVDFKEKNIKELKVAAKDARKALVDLSVQKEQRKLKNLHEVANKKKELAQILTFIRKKELEIK